jgi:hypothetical protein
MTVTVLNSVFKPLLETRLPSWVDARWYADKDEAFALAPAAEIGWFDMYSKDDMAEVFTRAAKLKWLNSVYAGVEAFPLDLLSQRGVMLTNGAGINAVPIAEYVLMLMLAQAKGYREVVRAQERREWLKTSPGKRELFGSQVLILGYGAIGQEVEARLAGFGAHVTKVRRSAGPGTLGPEEWRAQLGMFAHDRRGRAGGAKARCSAGQYRAGQRDRSGGAGRCAGSRGDWRGTARRDHARAAPARTSTVDARQCAGHHALVGQRADADVSARCDAVSGQS